MKGSSVFMIFGLIWFGAGFFWLIQLGNIYGDGLPKNPAEWLGEIFVGMMFIAGSAMCAVGQYLKTRS